MSSSISILIPENSKMINTKKKDEFGKKEKLPNQEEQENEDWSTGVGCVSVVGRILGGCHRHIGTIGSDLKEE
ncbi:MAG: hypothetical protein WCP70_01350 [Methanothrix sp.]